jgi:hypothetical protein
MPSLSRQALYDQVWAEPMRTLAERYNLSDVGFAKICRAADIPTPPRGYWAKKAAGKAPPRLRLPPRGPGGPDSIRFGPEARFRWPPDPEAELAEPPPEPSAFSEPLEETLARITKMVGRVPARPLAAAHPVVAKLLAKDDQRREKRRTSSYPSFEPSPVFDDAFQRRRLKILNTLFRALADAGCRPSIHNLDEGRFGVNVGAVYVSFTLDRPGRDQRSRRVQTSGSELLRLEIERLPESQGHMSVWVDDVESRLEDHVTEIVVALVAAGEIQYRDGSQAGYERALKRRAELKVELEKARAEAKRKAREMELAAKKKRRELLLGQARDWRLAEDIRAFVATMQARRPDDVGLGEWVTWALEEADTLDPVLRIPESPEEEK